LIITVQRAKVKGESGKDRDDPSEGEGLRLRASNLRLSKKREDRKKNHSDQSWSYGKKLISLKMNGTKSGVRMNQDKVNEELLSDRCEKGRLLI